MVSDDDMASGSMDHVDRDDDYRLILLTAKYVDTYIHMCDITLLLSIGTVQGSTDICLFLVQMQLIYIYLY